MSYVVETHEGLEFLVPQWNKEAGRWERDPGLEDRILRQLRDAVPNHEELVAEAAEHEAPRSPMCRTYWGSHGCDREYGHPGLHVCGVKGDLCSAILPVGSGDTCILWWAGNEGRTLQMSALHWRWFK